VLYRLEAEGFIIPSNIEHAVDAGPKGSSEENVKVFHIRRGRCQKILEPTLRCGQKTEHYDYDLSTRVKSSMRLSRLEIS
nr:hypothetical protein [Tanacetum cinerariifolium]